ncbi:MliC family protein [Shewanella sp. NIFS-20-20]|uniref:MliC family protein n=1 Tax=Shewanella sp. NIFS-20-20 TaxID=2853806 RepID=UPI001C463330|nr:MliC family protein [Shewanella sp. NIFS-20-20]MBV7316514.1 MliC family protein [Shewanella sp. NIFS-20-20]
MVKSVLSLALFTSGFLFCVNANAAAFDCSKADGTVEEYICQHPDLQQLDSKLNDSYQSVLSQLQGAEKSTLKAVQRGWIKARNECWKSDKLGQCINHSYRSRLTELQIADGKVAVPTPVFYQCDNAKLEVYFYNDTEVPAAVINLLPQGQGDDQRIAMISESASGAKYEAQNLTLWTKGQSATLIRYGLADEQCRATNPKALTDNTIPN